MINEPKKERQFDSLAVERTELALERTHLAWIRTVTAIITSGFAIDKLVEAFREKRVVTGEALVQQAHMTGLVLTCTGTILMLLVTLSYIRRSKQLKKMKPEPQTREIPGIVLSCFVFLVGALLSFLIIVS